MINIVGLVVLAIAFPNASLGQEQPQKPEQCDHKGQKFNPGSIITKEDGGRYQCAGNGKWQRI